MSRPTGDKSTQTTVQTLSAAAPHPSSQHLAWLRWQDAHANIVALIVSNVAQNVMQSTVKTPKTFLRSFSIREVSLVETQRNERPHFDHTWVNVMPPKIKNKNKNKNQDRLTEHRRVGYPNHSICRMHMAFSKRRGLCLQIDPILVIPQCSTRSPSLESLMITMLVSYPNL